VTGSIFNILDYIFPNDSFISFLRLLRDLIIFNRDLRLTSNAKSALNENAFKQKSTFQ